MNYRSAHPCPEHASASGRDQVAGWFLSVLMMAGLAGAAPYVEGLRNKATQLHAGNVSQLEAQPTPNRQC